MFDIQTLKNREVTLIEKLSGTSFSALADENSPKGPLFTALAFIIKQRENSEFTWDQAEDMTFSETAALMGTEDVDDDPKAS